MALTPLAPLVSMCSTIYFWAMSMVVSLGACSLLVVFGRFKRQR